MMLHAQGHGQALWTAARGNAAQHAIGSSLWFNSETGRYRVSASGQISQENLVNMTSLQALAHFAGSNHLQSPSARL